MPDSSPSEPPPPSAAVTVEDLGAALFLLGRLFIRMAPRDLSLTASSTMVTLTDHGPLRMTTLAEIEGVTQPSMSELVNRLQRDGLVVRQRDAEDGRAVCVAATAAGQALVAERRRERASRLAGLVGTLGEEDRRALVAAEPAIRHLIAKGFAGIDREARFDQERAPTASQS